MKSCQGKQKEVQEQQLLQGEGLEKKIRYLKTFYVHLAAQPIAQAGRLKTHSP
jgi:hypothetical protein